MKRYIRTNSTSDYIRKNQNMPKGGYLYIFKHGIGPGTLPRDVEIIRTKDLPNYYTAVWLDRFLTTSEMDKYDIPYETEINKYLDHIGYCQKDGDVIPCDNVMASKQPKWWDSQFTCKVIDAYNAGELTFDNMKEWETEYNGGIYTNNLGTKAILEYYLETGKDPRDGVEACDKVTTSGSKYFANMVSCSMNGTQAIAYKNIKHCFENLTGEWYNCILDGCPEYIPDSLEEAKQLVYEECLVNKHDKGYCGSGKAPKEMRFAGTQFIRDSIDKLFSEDKDGDVACCAEEKGWH